MAAKLRISLAICLAPVVLGAVGTVQASDATQTSDDVVTPRPSCASTGLAESGDDVGADMFGASVALSGQTAMATMPGFDSAFISPPVPPPFVVGRVAVFTCEAATKTWTRTASIQLPATEDNQRIAFGASVALEGNLAAIGAQYGVFLYKGQGANWKQVAKIVPDNSVAGAPVQLWGSVIALSDHVLAVGVTEITSPSSAVPHNYFVDVYQVVAFRDRAAAIRIARLRPPAGDTGMFGASLALKEDMLVVGDPPTTTAYLYRRHGFTFRLDQKLTGAEATASGGFGTAVAISKDVVMVGAPGENLIFGPFGVESSGAVYVFRHKPGPGSPWVETQHFNPGSGPYSDFGGSLAVNRHGLAVIGTPGTYDNFQMMYGPTFTYTLQGGQFVPAPTQIHAPQPATSMEINDQYLMTGFVAHAGAGGFFSGVTILNLKEEIPAN